VRIVLVDDHALFRDGVASLLLAWGHEVVGQASDGGEAVELVDQTSPDVVLMDVRMANVGGIEATARIKERHPEVAIVMLTVSEDEADLFRAIKAGAQGYLLKNLEAPQLRSMLEGVARGEPAITPATAARIIDEFLRTPGGHPKATGRLTERELEVLQLVTAGLRNREIGTELGITENTVKFHLKNIVEKLHALNRADLAARAVREGLVPDQPRDFISHERPHRDAPPRHHRPSR
jgi:DNA-binding NarL/FixJ family response regulator